MKTCACRLVLLLLLSIPTMAHAEFRHWDEWTRKEKTAFGIYNTLAYTDYSQTRVALSHECECYVEANPIFGKSPHPDKILLINVLASASIYHLVGKSEPDTSLRFMGTLSAIRFGVIIHNERVGITWRAGF